MSYLTPYRQEIEAALAAGAPVGAIAKALRVPRSSLRDHIESWDRPQREDRGAAELEALRRLANAD